MIKKLQELKEEMLREAYQCRYKARDLGYFMSTNAIGNFSYSSEDRLILHERAITWEDAADLVNRKIEELNNE